MEHKDIQGVDLLTALADELKLPLTQIARTAELATSDMAGAQLKIIETTSNNALKLIDSYLLVADNKQKQLDLSPVSVTATLYDVAQDLYDLSKLYDANIDIKVQGSPGQVMANVGALRAALSGVVYSFVSSGIRRKDQSITLLAKRNGPVVTTAVLSTSAAFTSQDWHSAKKLLGGAKQPATGITPNSGIGLYMADWLFDSMASPLKVVKIGNKTGLASNLLASQQLALL